ncbi:Mediator of RNA polymerase II transcription subunit 25 [Morella rubra]|uniref:Mediator of RNA polymerase II transcription subunit 25 n=1 Tax=Morella rubra TaxID=262757 RepID=A0A6A1WBS1_9ROSI|nr:Mediator of RNA polymerase II transcription subunit 25 [Morella rubra]
MAEKQLIVAVEGTAAMGPYWQTIVSDYLEKIIRCFCGNESNGQVVHVLEMSLFNRCFRIESKEFHVRISEKGDLLFSEWSSRTVNEIHMGKYGAVWMVNMSDKLLVASHAVDFASKFTESRHGFLAQRCCNKGGRYIAVVEYGGRRKLGAVLVPEGKHGHGWQILNRVFLEAVSCFRSASLSVTRVESSRIRPEDSFAKVVLAPAVVHDDGGRSSAPVQISRVADTSNTVYMQQNPEVGPLPKLISSSMSKENAEEGKCPAGLSDREALSLNGADLGKQVMSLRKEVDWLASLLRQQCQGGFSFPALSCSVCGFTLKAQQARAHPPCKFIGRAFGLPCGGPNFGAGDSGVSLGKLTEARVGAPTAPALMQRWRGVVCGGRQYHLRLAGAGVCRWWPAVGVGVRGSSAHLIVAAACVGRRPTRCPAGAGASFWWSVAGAGGDASVGAEGSRC